MTAAPDAALEAFDHPRFGRIAIRPVREDDAPRIATAVARQAPEDMRLRFFHALEELSDDTIRRMTRFVPAEEVTFVAEAADGALLGGVRLVRGPAPDEAEFAITIASRAKGAGLGRRLLDRGVRYARELGLARLHGVILRENAPMLGLARALGFALEPAGEGPDVVRATLKLR